jgi:hypothetical protein
VAYLEKGTDLTKHGHSGKPHSTYVFMEKGMIFYCKPGKRETTGESLSLAKLKKIHKGKVSDVMKRSTANRLDEGVCLTLVGAERELNLQFDSVAERDAFAEAVRVAFQTLTKKTPSKPSAPKPPSRPTDAATKEQGNNAGNNAPSDAGNNNAAEAAEQRQELGEAAEQRQELGEAATQKQELADEGKAETMDNANAANANDDNPRDVAQDSVAAKDEDQNEKEEDGGLQRVVSEDSQGESVVWHGS